MGGGVCKAHDQKEYHLPMIKCNILLNIGNAILLQISGFITINHDLGKKMQYIIVTELAQNWWDKLNILEMYLYMSSVTFKTNFFVLHNAGKLSF